MKIARSLVLLVVSLGLVAAAAAPASAAPANNPKLKTDWARKGIFTFKPAIKGDFQSVTEVQRVGLNRLIVQAKIVGHNRTRYIAFKLDKNGHMLARRGHTRRYAIVGDPRDRRVTSVIDLNGHIYYAFRRVKNGPVFVSRSKADLSPDRRFGMVRLPNPPATRGVDGSWSDFTGLVIHPLDRGGILVATQTDATSSAIVRIGDQGKVDASFGDRKYPGFGIRAIADGPDDTTYLAGKALPGDSARIERVLPTGAPDPAYAAGGIADIGGASHASRIDDLAVHGDGSATILRLHTDAVASMPGSYSVTKDVTRVDSTGKLDAAYAMTGSVPLLNLFPGSDNAPDYEHFAFAPVGDGLFAAYFANYGTNMAGSYYWLNGAGGDLGFPASMPNFYVKKPAIQVNQAVPAVRGGFFACGAIKTSNKFSAPTRIAIARYAAK